MTVRDGPRCNPAGPESDGHAVPDLSNVVRLRNRKLSKKTFASKAEQPWTRIPHIRKCSIITLSPEQRQAIEASLVRPGTREMSHLNSNQVHNTGHQDNQRFGTAAEGQMPGEGSATGRIGCFPVVLPHNS